MNISKILSVFLILAIMTSISVVSLAAKETKETKENVTDESDIAVSEIEEAKLPSAAEEKARFENRMKYAPKLENKSVEKSAISISNIPSSIPSEIAYTNPISGISVFATLFGSVGIYSGEYTQWTSYDFYLPIASYVNMEVSGRLHNIHYGAYYDMYVDTDQLNSGWDDGLCSIDYCYMSIQRSRLTYLPKGWHTLYVNGFAGVYNDVPYYAFGYISITAFPEYTAITVTSPNGNENWYRGQTKSITWKKDGQPGANVKIELYKAGVLSSVISSKTPNDGIYSWYIPTYTPIGTDYKIKISSTSETKYYDWSNNNFKIY